MSFKFLNKLSITLIKIKNYKIKDLMQLICASWSFVLGWSLGSAVHFEQWDKSRSLKLGMWVHIMEVFYCIIETLIPVLLLYIDTFNRMQWNSFT